MGRSKSELFSAQQNRIASLAKAFSHPARVAILQHLFKINTCVCGSLVDEIGLSQPTISQHLKELKNLGLIQGRVEGTSVCYCIAPDQWAEMRTEMTAFFNQEAPQVDCC